MLLKCWKTNKTCYATRRIAQAELQKVRKYGTTDYLPTRVYNCDWCGVYHLTSLRSNRR